MMKRDKRPYLYLLPALLLAALFVYYPFIRSIISSFFSVSINGKLLSFAGLTNYEKLFSESAFYESLGNTLLFMVIFVPLNLCLIITAVLLTAEKKRGIAISELLYMLPMAIGMSSAALIFKIMFNPTAGAINRIFNTNIQWTNEALPAMFSVAFLGVFLDFGIDYILLLSAMRNLDKSAVEAAQIDGAGRSRIFLSIKLPLMMPTLFFILFTSIKDAFLICAPIMVMTEGGPYRSTQTIVYYYYLEAFKNQNYAYSATISTIVFILSGLFILIAGRFEKRRINYR